jgi:hypothetical protein
LITQISKEDYTDFLDVSMHFVSVSSVPNPCLPVGRDVIRDFWTFSEISNDLS